MSGDGGGGDGDADAAGMEDMGFDAVSAGQSSETSAAAATGGATGIGILDQMHNAIQNPNNFADMNSPGSQAAIAGIPGANAASQTVQGLADLADAIGVAGDDGPASGSGTGSGDTDVGSGGADDAGGAVGDTAAPLPIPGTPEFEKKPFQPLPPKVNEKSREVTPLPKIGTSPLDSIIASPEDVDRPKAVSKIEDEVEEASRKRFLNEGGALGLRGTRGLTLARPEAFGVLRLGQ